MLIYKATNIINNKIYIGQTQNSLEQRKASHKKDFKTQDSYFYRAIRKYGWENFKWEVIKDDIQTVEELNYWEEYYIKLYNTFDNKEKGYNSLPGGLNHTPTEEEKKRRSERVKGEKNPMYGKPGTWLGKKFSEEHKKKISDSLKGQKKPWIENGNNPAARSVTNLTTQEEFDTIKQAAEKYKISTEALGNHLRRKTHSCCGCIWCYTEDKDKYKNVDVTKRPTQNKYPIYVEELDQTFKTAKETAEAIGCSLSLVSQRCKQNPGEYGIAKGFHVKYLIK